MSDSDLEKSLQELVGEERKLTCRILELIRESERRRVYLKRGYGSLFEWLVRAMGYSHSAAYRRIQAAKLIRDVPGATQKIESGAVNLTTITQMQTAVRRHERITGQYVSRKAKAELLDRISDKTSEQTQRIMTEIFPEAVPGDSLRPVSPTESRLSVTLDEETLDLLRRLRDQISHSQPEATWSDVIKFALKKIVLAADRLPKESANPSFRTLRRMVLQRAKYSCEYKDPESGRVCGSRYQVEVDHIKPKSLGGLDDVGNLRCLCKQHNLLEAEKKLGRSVMGRFWPGKADPPDSTKA